MAIISGLNLGQAEQEKNIPCVQLFLNAQS